MVDDAQVLFSAVHRVLTGLRDDTSVVSGDTDGTAFTPITLTSPEEEDSSEEDSDDDDETKQQEGAKAKGAATSKKTKA